MLENAKFKFEVWIDHKDLKHVLELRVEKSDGLSRRLNLKIVVENNNKKWVWEIIEVVVEELEMILVEIKKTRGKDKEIVKVVKEI